MGETERWSQEAGYYKKYLPVNRLYEAGALQNQYTDVGSKEETGSENKIFDDKKEEETSTAPTDETETSQNQATDARSEGTSGSENMVCGSDNKANDDMLRANCLANKSDVSQENQAQDGSLMVINTILNEELENISKKLDEQKTATMEFAGKDIKNQTKIFELEDKLKTLEKSCDYLRDEKFKIEHQLEQQKTAQGKERQRLSREMAQKTQLHNEELKNQKEWALTEIEKRNKERKKQKDEIGDKGKEIKKLKEELSYIKSAKNEVEKQQALAEEDRSRLHRDKLNMSKELSQARDERIVLQNEIKEERSNYNRLAVELMQTREKYAEKVNSLKAEIQQLESDRKDLLLRLSKLAGANLTYNNPNIVDLSDNKRPTKLAEEFSELYDNEWTDAFEEIEAENEECKSKFMLELLMRANQLCHDLSNDHTKMVKQSLSTLTLLIPSKHEQGGAGGSSIKDQLCQGKQSQYKPEIVRKETLQEYLVQNTVIYNGNEERRQGTEDEQDKLTVKVDSADKSPDELESGGNDENNPDTTQSCTVKSDEAEDIAGTKKKQIPVTVTQNDLDEEDEDENQPRTNVAKRNDTITEIKPKKVKLESDFEKLQTEQKKTIFEATKFFETLLSEDLKKTVTEVIVNEKGIDEKEQKYIIAYLERCIDLCWSMLRHRPPVHVDCPDMISDTPFDTNKYKPYTKTGKHLAYIVWPALYLHEGGPLLSKGVAQGK